MIDREDYLKRLIGLKDKRIIKVITGVRRCGKSTLLKLYQNYLIEIGVTKDQIIDINFEDFDAIDLCDGPVLYRYIKKDF